jgi:hypothetical protein
MFLACRNVVFRKNRLGRTFRLTQGAVDAFDRIDDQKIWTFMETVDWADLDAVGVFAADAVFGHDKWHKSPNGSENP